ncbi:hypothetical protein [Pseudoduganella sp. R-43]|uniref:hypothetical protein n=1 Tax=Pseudoduganella sp. R-43 TaxID=3404063 RepID=UPI003CF06F62
MNRLTSFTLLYLLALLPCSHSSAADLSGTWRFEKASAYYRHQKTVRSPGKKILQIVNNRTNFDPRCLGTYQRKKYYYSELFQLALKGGVSETALGAFIRKEFDVALPKNGFYYHLEGPSQDCSEEFEDVLVDGDRLLVAAGGETFYSFVRAGGMAANNEARQPELAGLSPSHLPFDAEIFANHCESHLAGRGGGLRETSQCSPVFNPYIARKESANYIAQLVGHHDYRKGGASFADDYATPFSHGLHPVFNVLPPFKGIVVVRVNDLEAGENRGRDVMGGAYLSIKSGKVVDQLNVRCNLTEEYICVDEDGNPEYQLLESGKFKRIRPAN